MLPILTSTTCFQVTGSAGAVAERLKCHNIQKLALVVLCERGNSCDMVTTSISVYTRVAHVISLLPRNICRDM